MDDRSCDAVAGHAKCRVEQRPVAVALDTGEQTERRIELQSCTEMVAIQTRSLKLNIVSHHLHYMTAHYNLILHRERALGATIEQTQLVWTDQTQHSDQGTVERRSRLTNFQRLRMCQCVYLKTL